MGQRQFSQCPLVSPGYQPSTRGDDSSFGSLNPFIQPRTLPNQPRIFQTNPELSQTNIELFQINPELFQTNPEPSKPTQNSLRPNQNLPDQPRTLRLTQNLPDQPRTLPEEPRTLSGQPRTFQTNPELVSAVSWQASQHNKPYYCIIGRFTVCLVFIQRSIQK